MSRTKILISIFVILITGITLAIYLRPQLVKAECGRSNRSMVNASSAEMGTIAIGMACRDFAFTANPNVILSRTLVPSDLSSIHLAPEDICAGHTLDLVILKGDFHYTNAVHGTQSDYSYVAYVIDREEGIDIMMATSKNGGPFRKLLNDPSLPDDPIIVPKQSLTKVLSPEATDPPEINEIPKNCGDASIRPTRAPSNK